MPILSFHFANSLRDLAQRAPYLLGDFDTESRGKSNHCTRPADAIFEVGLAGYGSLLTGYQEWPGGVPPLRSPLDTMNYAPAISGAAVDAEVSCSAWGQVAAWLLGSWAGLGYFVTVDDTPLEAPRADLTYISDGGHSENLGVFTAVRNGCRNIIALDATEDPRLELADLKKLAAQFRADPDWEGLYFEGETEAPRPDLIEKTQGVMLATLRHATDRTRDVRIVYVKNHLADASKKFLPELHRYRKKHSRFPHHATMNQFFSAERYRAYRELGRFLGARATKRMFDPR